MFFKSIKQFSTSTQAFHFIYLSWRKKNVSDTLSKMTQSWVSQVFFKSQVKSDHLNVKAATALNVFMLSITKLSVSTWPFFPTHVRKMNILRDYMHFCKILFAWVDDRSDFSVSFSAFYYYSGIYKCNFDIIVKVMKK
jgi:hypothetical protein